MIKKHLQQPSHIRNTSKTFAPLDPTPPQNLNATTPALAASTFFPFNHSAPIFPTPSPPLTTKLTLRPSSSTYFALTLSCTCSTLNCASSHSHTSRCCLAGLYPDDLASTICASVHGLQARTGTPASLVARCLPLLELHDAAEAAVLERDSGGVESGVAIEGGCCFLTGTTRAGQPSKRWKCRVPQPGRREVDHMLARKGAMAVKSRTRRGVGKAWRGFGSQRERTEGLAERRVWAREASAVVGPCQFMSDWEERWWGRRLYI